MIHNIFNRLFLLFIFFATSLIAQDFSAGIKLIKNEKYSEAKKYFSSYLNTSSASIANFYLGQIALIKGEIDSAKYFFEQGIINNSSLALNYAGMVKVNLIEDDQTNADLNERKAIELTDDKNESVYLVLAEGYILPNINKYDKAIDMINKALLLNPQSIDGYILLGKLYLNKGNGTEAIKNFEKALDINKNNPEAMILKAKVYSLINNYDEAIKLLNYAISIDSTYSPVYNSIAEVYASIKDYGKAAEYYGKYLSTSELSSEKLKRYVQFLYLNKDYEKVIKILEGNETSEKDIISSTRILAYSYLRINDLENSKRYFEKLFSLPNAEFLPTDYENYADLLSSAGNDSLAIENLLKIVSLDSTRKDILGKISFLSFKNKKWNQVIDALEKKKTLTTQEYFDLGKAYIFKGDEKINELIENLKQKLSLNDEQVLKLRILLLNYQKELKGADQDSLKINSALDRLIQSTESLIAANQKSKWLANKKTWGDLVRTKIWLEYAMADSAFSNLSSKAPNLPIAYIWRARVNTNFDPESVNGLAKPFYEQFIKLASDDSIKYKKELVEAYSYLGYYYYLQKDNELSKKYWGKVILLDPENTQAKEVIKQLK